MNKLNKKDLKVNKNKSLNNKIKKIEKYKAYTLENKYKGDFVNFNIIGLDCAHCASVIEEKVSKMENIKECSLNFITKELKIKFDKNINNKEEFNKIQNLISSIENGVKIEEKNEDTKNKLPEKENLHNKNKIIQLALGVIFFAGAMLTNTFLLFLISYLILGYDVLIKAIKNIFKGKVFDENFLMSIATIGAFAIKEFPEAVGVMFLYQIGEYFQEIAVGKSRNAIKSLINIKAEYATKENGEKVSPENVLIGETIVVKTGEKVALDGEVIEGSSFLDMSALIGESVPRKVGVGSEVLSGSINTNGLIKVRVTKEYSSSTVAKILDLVENASSKKSKAESFISKFAQIYTPIIVFLALILAIVPPFFTNQDFSYWLKNSLVFLVSSCPCALVISVPLSFFSGIGFASKNGILIKGSAYMQNLSQVDTIVFDKTGTLTKGVFEISKIFANNIDEKELLKIAYALEKNSIHPVAKSISSYYLKNINEPVLEVSKFEEISGFGLKAMLKNEEILLGNDKLLDKHNIKFEKAKENGTAVYIAKNGEFLGYIIVSDIIKEDAKSTIEKLKQINIKNLIMLSGDRKEVAEYVSKEIGLTQAFAELLPQDKVSMFEKISKNGNGKVAYVGDGINDAPVLAISDVGFAMGGVGSDSAIEASDIIIMNDDINKIYDSIIISKNTLKIVKNNVIFSLAIKFIVLILAIFGLAPMWLGVFADVGVTLLAILNSMRNKYKKF